MTFISRLRDRLKPYLPQDDQDGEATAPPLRTILREAYATARRDRVLAASWLALLGLALAYTIAWTNFCWPWLTDGHRQTDDARTQIMPMHRYGSEGALRNDEVARDALATNPYALRLLYAATMTVTDVFGASKVIQLICLGVVVAAAYVLARRRSGAAGVLLFVAFIHSYDLLERITSALPRAFGFPAVALWAAGALAGSGWGRAIAIWIGALFYPSAAALLLAAEGLHAVLVIAKRGRGQLLPRGRQLLLVTGVAVVIVLPQAVYQNRVIGPVYTMEEALTHPAFNEGGRNLPEEQFPFKDPGPALRRWITAPFEGRGPLILPVISENYRRWEFAGPLVWVTLLMLFAGVATPRVFFPCAALGGASVLVYALARPLAFKLYVPERYLQYGLPIVALMLLAGPVAHLVLAGPPRRTLIARNFLAAGLMGTLWLVTGLGHGWQPGVRINYDRFRAANELVRTLPLETRIASHPWDGDDFPYWTGRASVTGHETGLPWFKAMWTRYDRRARDTLRGLYATDARAFWAYVAGYRVTHLWLDPGRYEKDVQQRARFIEPYNALLDELLRDVQPEQLYLREIPDAAVLLRERNMVLVDVGKLREGKAHGGP